MRSTEGFLVLFMNALHSGDANFLILRSFVGDFKQQMFLFSDGRLTTFDENFRRRLEYQLCKYAGITASCNETEALYYAHFFDKDNELWNSAGCGTLFYNNVCSTKSLLLTVNDLYH